MITISVSSKGQVVLPADVRHRLGLGAGSKLQLIEQPDGLELRVLSAAPPSDVAGLAGLVSAPTTGVSRRLEDFDPASMLQRQRK